MPESSVDKGQKDQGHKTWFKQKTWVCLPPPQRQSLSSRHSSGLYASVCSYRELLNQTKLAQVRERVASHCAIALRGDPSHQSLPTSSDSSSQVDQLKDSFLSTISHELRTPISTIKMAVQMLTLALSREGLLAQVGNPALGNNKIAHYLKILNEECNREIGLITDLLDLQRLEAAIQPINVQPISLASYLTRIVRPFQEQAQTQQHVLTVDLPPELPVLLSDAQSLERVLVELLTNACKYTPASETISISLRLTPVDHAGRQTVVFQVSNSGVEVTSEQLSRMFDKFYRVPTSDPHRHPGTGLGLALVKKLVAQLGGTIQVESLGQQICFSVELPLNSDVRLPCLASVSAPAG